MIFSQAPLELLDPSRFQGGIMKGITPMRKVPRIFWPTVMLFFFLSAGSIWSGFFFPDIRPGYGVTSQGWLPNYFALLDLEGSVGVTGKLEKSNPSFRGLSHFEIGNGTDCISFLFETPNPGMDRWREKPDPIGNRKYPLEHRVGTALMVFKHLAESYGTQKNKKLVMKGLPDYPDMVKKGVGAFLN